MRWVANFKPISTSPNGKLVYGIKVAWPDNPPRYLDIAQVRRVRDGKIVRSFRGDRLGFDVDWVSHWDGSNAFLVQRSYRSSGRAVLVRCAIAGGCVRASAPSDRYDVFSFASTS